jgi:hypothetical protein
MDGMNRTGVKDLRFEILGFEIPDSFLLLFDPVHPVHPC